MKIEFPEAVEKEAAVIDVHREVTKDEIATRRDMRGTTTFTIDPTDAKDFDDAISVRFLEDDRIEIGVHIADVTHYVRPNSALDREARERGTSIYLVDRTIPMLPEILSNDLCSLKPNVDRLAFSAIFVVNAQAEVLERWFGKTIIHSNHRFTYQSAQDVLDGNDATFSRELTTLATLGKHLRTRREKAGALAFETDEVRFELDTDNNPVRAYVKERLETMKVIEDWMLLANQEVATWVAQHVKDKKPLEQTFLYRIHDVPSSDRVEELRIFLKAIGHELGQGGDVHAKDINSLLKNIRGTPHEAVVNIATLRTMAKAVYSHKNIGHFSLAFKYYTHFTSPIRRYPDMIVHRILLSHLSGTPLSKEELISYQRAAIDCSEREVAAVEAERESIRYMQLKYMQSRIGQTFTGVVTGVIEAGIFVAEKESRAEGLIHVSTLDNDYYTYDQKHYALVGRSSKRRFTLGDEVKMNLVAVDLDERRIEWKLA
jgi:ribonuclease R